MEKLFGHGRHPVSGEPLGRPFVGEDKPSAKALEGHGGAGEVAGYAVSFSPPKSISLLWALADEATSAKVRAAHDAAIEAALEFLQDHAAFTRRGKGGVVQADTEGYVAAAFTHRTSRAGDPQLHTHVLLSAKVRATTDGAWLALDGRELYEVQKAAGHLYKAGFRAELTARLGVEWTPVGPDGAAEVVEVPPELVEHFSKRRAQVEARAATMIAEREASLGRSLRASERAGTYQLAAYKSRSAKPEGGERTEHLRERWRYEATEAGYPPEAWLARALGPPDSTVAASSAQSARPGAGVEKAMAEVLEAIESACSTWGRADVVEAVAARAAPTTGSGAEAVRELVEAVADELLARPGVVSLGPGALITERAPEVLRRADGMEPTVRHGAPR